MVRTCGLCQAVAFSVAKAKDNQTDREKAHKLLLEHVGKLVNKGENPFDAIREADATEYMLMTRNVLSAWIYFKRFSDSIIQEDAKGDKE